LSRGLPAAADTAIDETRGSEKLSRFATTPAPDEEALIDDLERTLRLEPPQLVKSAATKAHAVRERDL